jgi:hypothetical protein
MATIMRYIGSEGEAESKMDVKTGGYCTLVVFLSRKIVRKKNAF